LQFGQMLAGVPQLVIQFDHGLHCRGDLVIQAGPDIGQQ
jgi:hypothetical protein